MGSWTENTRLAIWDIVFGLRSYLVLLTSLIHFSYALIWLNLFTVTQIRWYYYDLFTHTHLIHATTLLERLKEISYYASGDIKKANSGNVRCFCRSRLVNPFPLWIPFSSFLLSKFLLFQGGSFGMSIVERMPIEEAVSRIFALESNCDPNNNQERHKAKSELLGGNTVDGSSMNDFISVREFISRESPSGQIRLALFCNRSRQPIQIPARSKELVITTVSFSSREYGGQIEKYYNGSLQLCSYELFRSSIYTN